MMSHRKLNHRFFIGIMLMITMGITINAMSCGSSTSPCDENQENQTEDYSLSFDELTPGSLPAGWKADATDPQGDLATWEVVADPNAPSHPNVLSITQINDDSSNVFNLFWTSDVTFQDGTVEVKIRANTGDTD